MSLLVPCGDEGAQFIVKLRELRHLPIWQKNKREVT